MHHISDTYHANNASLDIFSCFTARINFAFCSFMDLSDLSLL